MSRGRSSEAGQIEFLPPNDTAFGVADVADFVGFDGGDDTLFGDEGPRSRWLPAIASFVVLTFIAGGVIAAAPWDEDVATPPQTTLPPTTTTAPDEPGTTMDRGVDRPTSLPGFVFGDPGPFHLAGLWSAGPEQRPVDTYADDWFALWASDGATRTTGRWLAITTIRSRSDYVATWHDGVRLEAGRGIGVVATSDDGVVRMLFEASDRTPFEVAGFGFTQDELLEVAGGVAGASGAAGIELGALPGTVLAGTTLQLEMPVASGGLDPLGLLPLPDAGAWYEGPGLQSVETRVAPRESMDDALYEFLFRDVVDLDPLDHEKLVALDRSHVDFRLRTHPDRPGTTFVASWRSTRGEVTVMSVDVAIGVFLDLLPTVRLAPSSEWDDLLARSARGELPGDPVREPGFVPTSIGEGIPRGDQSWWRIDMAATPAPWVFISAMSTGWGGPLGTLPEAPTVHTFASSTMTFVVATAAWNSTATTMRVTLDGQSPVDVPMVAVGKAWLAAAHGFHEMSPYTVELLDAAGHVVSG